MTLSPIRNACRVLMILGMKGCWVFPGNPEGRGSLPQRMGVRRHSPKLCESRIDPESRLVRCSHIQRTLYSEAAD